MGAEKVSDEEIKLIAPVLKRIVLADRATREQVQQYGVSVIPADIYSNTPSVADIASSYEYAGGEPPYLDEIIFNRPRMAEVLAELAKYSHEFDPEVEGDEARARNFFWKNTMFSYSDAMAYYCFVRLLKPRTILEIGSGFSTLVAIEAADKNGAGQVICVEPYPRAFLEQSDRITLRKEKAQELRADYLNDVLQDGDILFIDSTHTVKTGSDCLHIYLRLLPRIRRNIHVHVHDIFLPFGMPVDWLLDWQYFWTEQYLLLALLTDSYKAKALYGSAYHAAFNRDELDGLMHRRYPYGGASFWFEYDGRREHGV